VRARHLVVALAAVLGMALATPAYSGSPAVSARPLLVPRPERFARLPPQPAGSVRWQERNVERSRQTEAGRTLEIGALAAVDSDQARAEAKRILSDRRFQPSRSPRPFEGLFRWLGRILVDPVRSILSQVGRHLPELGSPPWVVLALLVVMAAVAGTIRLSRDRARERFPRGGGRAGEDGLSPEDLERQAEEAERRGELADALRLRFRAGLLRLDGVGAIDLRPGLTNAAAARLLRSRRFEALAVDFDEVVYGGRTATTEDLAEARSEWPRLLEEARRR
jgi:hypothetical protein